MKKIIGIFFILCIVIVNGCSDDSPVSEQEAEQLVQEHHEPEYGEVEIKSVFSKDDKFIIEWAIEPVNEGVDSVHMETGEIKTIESSHGTCRWF